MSAKAKSERVSENKYLANDNSETSKPNGSTVAIRKTFSDGSKLVAKISDLPKEIKRACCMFGLNTKLNNAMAVPDAKNMTASEKAQLVVDCWDNLVQGLWNEEGGERGPNVKILIDALYRHRKLTPSDEQTAIWRAKLIQGDVAKTMAKDAHIAVHIAAIKQELAAVRAKEARELAKEMKVSNLLHDF